METFKKYALATFIGAVCLFIFWAVLLLIINIADLSQALN